MIFRWKVDNIRRTNRQQLILSRWIQSLILGRGGLHENVNCWRLGGRPSAWIYWPDLLLSKVPTRTSNA